VTPFHLFGRGIFPPCDLGAVRKISTCAPRWLVLDFPMSGSSPPSPPFVFPRDRRVCPFFFILFSRVSSSLMTLDALYDVQLLVIRWPFSLAPLLWFFRTSGIPYAPRFYCSVAILSSAVSSPIRRRLLIQSFFRDRDADALRFLVLLSFFRAWCKRFVAFPFDEAA